MNWNSTAQLLYRDKYDSVWLSTVTRSIDCRFLIAGNTGPVGTRIVTMALAEVEPELDPSQPYAICSSTSSMLGIFSPNRRRSGHGVRVLSEPRLPGHWRRTASTNSEATAVSSTPEVKCGGAALRRGASALKHSTRDTNRPRPGR
jgi:hypothetical protein